MATRRILSVNGTSKSVLLLGVFALLGALIWPLSPMFTGHREPWDSDSGYYWIALTTAGFLPACFSSTRFVLCAIGAWLGQAVSFLFIILGSAQPSGALWPVGLVLLCGYSLLGLAGAALGTRVHRLFRRLFLGVVSSRLS
jgi:hypothetical protein